MDRDPGGDPGPGGRRRRTAAWLGLLLLGLAPPAAARTASPPPVRAAAGPAARAYSASARDLPLLLERIEATPPRALHDPDLRAPLVEALRAVLVADPDAVRVLFAHRHRIEGDALGLVLEAVRAAGRPQGMRLAARFEDHPRGAEVLLTASLLGERFPWRADDLVRAARRALAGEAPADRAAAAGALGRLRDPGAVPRLVGLLDDTDPVVRSAAARALSVFAPGPPPAGAQGWRAWMVAERRWWRGSDGRLRAALSGEDAAALGALLRELRAHPWAAEALAGPAAETLARLDPARAAALCPELERLGSRRAVPGLAALLFLGDRALADAAGAALRGLTGEELPAEPLLWDRYTDG